MSITITDLFCGAGGSSSGAVSVPGVTVRMAANHWKLAIETHNTNHPDTDHDCADISQVDPRRYPRTDVLWASPECTNHSQAKGRKQNADSTPDLFGDLLPDEAAERSRATMWDVVRFAEHHRYKAIIVENVVEVLDWVMFPAWRHALDCINYCVHVVHVNSMYAQALGDPAPQSRDRAYVAAHDRSARQECPDLDGWIRPAARCETCGPVRAVQAWKRAERHRGRYGAQYVWRCPKVVCRNSVVTPGILPAAAAIDWTLPGQRIGDRTRPLKPKTRARIAAGLQRFAQPIHVEAAGNTFERRPGVRSWPLTDPLKTLHTTASKAVAVPPLLVPVEGRDGKAARTVAEPMRAQTARNETGVAVPPLATPPLLVPAGGGWNTAAAPVTEVMRTRTTRETEGVLVAPFVTELRGGGSVARSTTDPLATIVAAGNHHGLTVAGEWTAWATWAALYGYDTGTLRSPMHDVLPTQTTVEGDALLTSNPAPVRAGQVLTAELLAALHTFDGAVLTEPSVDDCLFRMLEPHEIGLGMAFAPGYVVLGNKRERVRQLGNAVTPPAARDLIACVVEWLTGETIDRPDHLAMVA